MSWFAIVAEFANPAERRGKSRRKLELVAELTAERAPAKVVVLDLSEAGMMLHSHEELEVDETFEVALPEAGLVEAQVVWKRSTLYGCKFLSPVTRGMISAVLLKARPDPSGFQE